MHTTNEWTTQDLLDAVNTARKHAGKAAMCALVASIFGALAIVAVLYGEPDFAGAAAVPRGGGGGGVTLCEDDAANDQVTCDFNEDGDDDVIFDEFTLAGRIQLFDTNGNQRLNLLGDSSVEAVISAPNSELSFAFDGVNHVTYSDVAGTNGFLVDALEGEGFRWDLASDGTADATWTESGTDGVDLASDHLSVTAAKSNDTITLSSGTGTATVESGANCTCTNTSAVTAVQCSVSGTTLTADDGTGSSSSVIAYHCF